MKDLQSEARIRDLEQRMAAMPGSRIFVGLAEEYRRAGRFSDAMAILRNGLEAHPTYLSARIAIARLYQETGRVQEAIDAFTKVLVSDRENLVAAKALGDLHGRQGNAVEAIKKLKLYRALSGDRAVDARIAALEREVKAEPAAPPPVSADPAAPPVATAAAPGVPPAAESRLFDPMNYADTSGAFELGPNAALALSTLDFTPTEEADLPIETTRPFEGSPAAPIDLPAVETLVERAESVPPVEVDAAPPEEPERMAEIPPAAEELESAEEVPADVPEAAEDLRGEELEAAEAVPDEPWEPAVEIPAEAEEISTSAFAELPPSRTLAELYERQGFPEEARQIYDRLAIDPRESAADWVLAAGPGAVPVPEPAAASATADSDPRERKRRTIEAWLVRIRTNAAAGAR